MPLVEVKMGLGRSAEQKHTLMAGITDAVVDSLGVPRESVRVWIIEVDPGSYMAGGKLVIRDRRPGGDAAATKG